MYNKHSTLRMLIVSLRFGKPQLLHLVRFSLTYISAHCKPMAYLVRLAGMSHTLNVKQKKNI